MKVDFQQNPESKNTQHVDSPNDIDCWVHMEMGHMDSEEVQQQLNGGKKHRENSKHATFNSWRLQITFQ